MYLSYEVTPVRCVVFGWPQNIVTVPGTLPVMGDKCVSLFSPAELGIPENGFP